MDNLCNKFGQIHIYRGSLQLGITRASIDWVFELATEFDLPKHLIEIDNARERFGANQQSQIRIYPMGHNNLVSDPINLLTIQNLVGRICS